MNAELTLPVSGSAPVILADALEFSHLPLRVRQVAILRGLGHSLREIGERMQVSPQAVSLMLTRYRVREQTLRQNNVHGSLANLSTRAVNALGRHRIRTAEQARAAGVPDLLQHERNCGRKTLEEIRRWMDASLQPTDQTPTPTT